MAQLRADIENKDADSGYKRTMTRSEPMKLMAALLAATATVVAAVFGALATSSAVDIEQDYLSG